MYNKYIKDTNKIFVSDDDGTVHEFENSEDIKELLYNSNKIEIYKKIKNEIENDIPNFLHPSILNDIVAHIQTKSIKYFIVLALLGFIFPKTFDITILLCIFVGLELYHTYAYIDLIKNDKKTLNELRNKLDYVNELLKKEENVKIKEKKTYKLDNITFLKEVKKEFEESYEQKDKQKIRV